MNLLCCAQNPSEGDIRIGELSIGSDQYAIRKILGECKQDDFLYPKLTALEHLELYAGIRGVSAKDMADTVQRWLGSVDLDDVQHIRVSAFSGGMKRRLSVANSTIGDARVVVLDEPTTGKSIQLSVDHLQPSVSYNILTPHLLSLEQVWIPCPGDSFGNIYPTSRRVA